MLALADGVVDILEVGVPFSDPVADAIVIQQASTRALSHDTTLHGVLDLITRFRKKAGRLSSYLLILILY